MKIYIVMCRNDGEPELAFTNKINALDYAEEFNSVGFYKVEVVEVELKKDIKEPAQPEQEKTHLLLRNDIVYAAYLRYLETKSD
jgi:hypothetical protein